MDGRYAQNGVPGIAPKKLNIADWCLRVQLGERWKMSVVGLRWQWLGMQQSNEMPSIAACCASIAGIAGCLCAHSAGSGCARGTISVAPANDNYFGYALKLSVEKRVTQLECAAPSSVDNNGRPPRSSVWAPGVRRNGRRASSYCPAREFFQFQITLGRRVQS